jgi:protein involved in sex pheromone biosynthesis
MKKILIVAATAGLMSLAACQPAANNTTVVDNTTVEANASEYNDTTVTTVDNAAPADANVTTTNTTGNAM